MAYPYASGEVPRIYEEIRLTKNNPKLWKHTTMPNASSNSDGWTTTGIEPKLETKYNDKTNPYKKYTISIPMALGSEFSG